MKKQKGFTILEIIVSISLFTMAIVISGSMYVLSQRTYNRGETGGELAQNARVCLDRISRELRQSVDIITDLPPGRDDPEDPPSEEIFFQDGHDISQITYLRYCLDGTDLKRRQLAYYFEAQPEIYVPYNSEGGGGETPEELVIEDRVVGEYFNNLNFWGSSGLVYVYLELLKSQDTFEIQTSVFSRN